MKWQIKDCTVEDLFNMCKSHKYCKDCELDKYALIPEEGGCVVDTLMNYEDIELDIPDKDENKE